MILAAATLPSPSAPIISFPPSLVSPSAQVTQPLIFLGVLAGTLGLCIVIASIYRWTHRGLSYSQTFQFSLVMLGMLGAVIMVVASTGVLRALAILGGFTLIRFRTPVKDPKDMAFILFVLAVGLAMGAQMYAVAAIATAFVSAVVIMLTFAGFGLSYSHESIIRLTCVEQDGAAIDTGAYETVLASAASSHHLLSAVGTGDRMELTYGTRPRRGSTNLAVLEALRAQPGIEHAELFDAKHQVEF